MFTQNFGKIHENFKQIIILPEDILKMILEESSELRFKGITRTVYVKDSSDVPTYLKKILRIF